ncbi:DUF1217 domain-containing protein [Ferrovibrio terrae]|uniref:DUF1217 domain-containing protein n=1 Tax=Ferrovibrio terrae TaxID=2594003 RepID=UPI003137CA11
MTIDLSVLYGTSSTSSTGSMSALAMYKKLQKTAEENESATSEAAEAEKVQTQIREMNNAVIKARNAQFKQINAQISTDVSYFQNRVTSATTVDELMNDDRFLKVIAYANGYEDLYLSNKQKLRDILTSDPSDASSVARQGTLKDLELAQKYGFGTTGTLTDVDGNTVGLDADGNIVNDDTVETALPAGLAKLRGLAVDSSGQALLDSDGALIYGTNLKTNDATAYSQARTKTLLTEETAPTDTDEPYVYAGEDFDRFTRRTDIQKDVAYFEENIGSVTSVDDLFADQRLLNFILKAYDMESEAQYPGKIRKILESDLTDSNSLANRFTDPRYENLAADLDLFASGVTTLTTAATIESITEKYQQTAYEKNLDEQAPGVRIAIEFKRRLEDVSTTVQLLGDSVLREVITKANYIPDELAYQETEAQIATVEKKVDVNELKNDPDQIEKIVLRYLSIKDSASTSSGSGDSYLLNLFA